MSRCGHSCDAARPMRRTVMPLGAAGGAAMRPSPPAQRCASAARPAATSRPSTRSRTSAATCASARSAAASALGRQTGITRPPVAQRIGRGEQQGLEPRGREPDGDVRQAGVDCQPIRIVGMAGADDEAAIHAAAGEEVGHDRQGPRAKVAHDEARQPVGERLLRLRRRGRRGAASRAPRTCRRRGRLRCPSRAPGRSRSKKPPASWPYGRRGPGRRPNRPRAASRCRRLRSPATRSAR